MELSPERGLSRPYPDGYACAVTRPGVAFRSVTMLIREWRGSMPWGVKIVQRSLGHALAAMSLNVCADVGGDDLNAPFNEKEDHPSRSLGVVFSGPDRRRSGDLSSKSTALSEVSADCQPLRSSLIMPAFCNHPLSWAVAKCAG